MLYDPIRVTLRLTKSDVDIISLMEYYRPRHVISLAVSRYLGQTGETLPLPPESSDKESLYRSVIFHRGDDEETYDFLASLPDGAVSTILKRLIRHATDKCDIRPLLAKTKDDIVDSKTDKPSDKHVPVTGAIPRASPLQEANGSGANDSIRKKKRRKKRNRPAAAAQPAASQVDTRPSSIQSAESTQKTPVPKPQHTKAPENKPAPDSIFDLI